MADAEVGKAHISIFPVMTGFKGKVDREVKGAASSASKSFSKGFSGAGGSAGTSLGRSFKSAFAKAANGTSDAALKPLQRDVARATAEMSKARAKMYDDAGRVRVAEMRLADAVAKSGEESTQAAAAEERLNSARRKLAASSARYKSSIDSLSVAQGALNRASAETGGVMSRAFSRAGAMAGGAFAKMRSAGSSAFNALPGFAQTALSKVGGMASSAASHVGSALSGAAGLVGRGLSSMASMAAAGIASAAAAVAAGAAALSGSALKSYASYEQLVGGVDTLFKDASGRVQEYASRAYRTSGLSANAYMEQVTGFSASLLQSLGGDTAKAADYADRAVRDMADNANKMGTSAQSIQDAYQGFAKQNYTMLDNLKLGYGGTKSEMERLVADANRVKAANGEMADLSIDSFADVTEAIHVIQSEMGITGTTAEEAEKTISGSVSSMKAAWSNWLAEMGKGNGDMGALTDQMVETVATAAGNILPRLGTIAGNLFSTLTSRASGWLRDDLPKRLDQFQVWVTANLPTLLQRGMDMLGSVAQGIVNNLPKIISVAGALIGAVASTILSNLPQMLAGGLQMMGNIASGFLNAVPQLVGQIPGIVDRMWRGFCDIDWGKVGRNIVDGIKNGLANAAWALVDAAKDLGNKALSGIKGVLGIKSPSRVFRDQVGKMIPAGIGVGIESGAGPMMSRASKTARALVDRVRGEVGDSGAVARGGSAGAGGVSQTFVFNQPIKSPDEVARQMRMERNYGIAASV